MMINRVHAPIFTSSATRARAPRPSVVPPLAPVRAAERRFFRVVYGASKDYARLRYLYGAELLFDPVLADPRALPRAPVRVPGVVLHNDLDADPRLFVGAKNPALTHRALEEKYSDKWEEQ